MASTTMARAASGNWKQEFEQVADEYFDQVYLHYGPSGATAVGYHQYDAQLEDLSQKNIDAEIADLKRFSARIEAIHPDASAEDFVPRSDRELVLNNIQSTLLELQTVRAWEKNPDNYSSICANGVFVLMERKFAPPDERLRAALRARGRCLACLRRRA